MYKITHWSKPYLAVTGKNTVETVTASEAWKLAKSLQMSDEEVEIYGPKGPMSLAYLRQEADREVRNA